MGYNKNSDILCDLCGYKFKTYSVQEDTYEDYHPVTVTRHYPLPEENAHLIKNYICDKCYNSFSYIVKQSLIDAGEKYIREFDKYVLIEYNRIKEEYNKKISKWKKDKEKIEKLLNELKYKELYELTQDDIKEYERNYPYVIKGTYYLDSAVEHEKRNKLNVKKVIEWDKQFNLDVEHNRSIFNLVNKQEYLDLLMDCKPNNITVKELLNVIDNERG